MSLTKLEESLFQLIDEIDDEEECYNAVNDLLEENDIDINIKNEEGATPLIRAAAVSNVQLVELLLSKGADVNASTNNGKTASSYANLFFNIDILDLLKKYSE